LPEPEQNSEAERAKPIQQRGEIMKVLNFGSLNIDYVYDVDDFVKKYEERYPKAIDCLEDGFEDGHGTFLFLCF